MFTLWFARGGDPQARSGAILGVSSTFLVFLAISYFVLTEVFFTPPEVWVETGDNGTIGIDSHRLDS